MPARIVWKLRNKEIPLDYSLIMVIINLTPDSFSDGGKFISPETAVARAVQLVEQGADMIDLGAESTRPGAVPISIDEEIGRILPVLTQLRSLVSVPISIDTTKPEVARRCLQDGADLINDVSGLKDSGREMALAVQSFGAGIILMHRRGDPETMQSLAEYQDVTAEIIDELLVSVNLALDYGLGLDQLAVDPGIGFAKTTEQNLQIMQGLERFLGFQRPLVVGPSRKSFIGEVTGRQVEEREFGTAAAVAMAVSKGAHVLRVHDVAAMRDVIRMTESMKGNSYVRAL